MDPFSDLAFFSLLVKHGSMAAAAQQLGVTPPAVSKRLAALERRLGVRLLQRTTRRIGLTPEGETYLVDGARVLEGWRRWNARWPEARRCPRAVARLLDVRLRPQARRADAVQVRAQVPRCRVQLHLTDRP
jgi:DNA-binding transcriptional LysR family regulator